ncbi:MAG: hypothetical protein ACKVOK_03270 [Flavobacteriales bacterium]
MKAMYLEKIARLKEEIEMFKKSKLYETSIPMRTNIKLVEIAILLAELKIDCNRSLRESDGFYFEGCYLVSYDCGSEWKDLADLYCEICDIVKKK